MRHALAVLAAASLAAGAVVAQVAESSWVVEPTKSSITVIAPSEVKRSVSWHDLTQVAIRTTDAGPQKPDVFWELHGVDAAGTIVFPSGATGEASLIEAARSRLKGFDERKLAEAMRSTSNEVFVLWEKGTGKGV